MELQSLGRRNLQKILLGIVLVSLGIHLLSLLLNQFVFPDWRWVHFPFHSSMEMAGSVIALFVAFLLVVLEKRNVGTSYNLRIAGALVGMGLLDGFHAMASGGQTFVWLHSLATFIGGVLFSLVWVPQRLFGNSLNYWPVVVGFPVMVAGLLSFQFPAYVPSMINSSGFTLGASVLNMAGGFLLLSASLKLLLTFRREGRFDNLLFSTHCLLFGAAGLMFEQSMLWNLTWWGWHVLRMLAYGAALLFAIQTIMRDQRDLREYREELEQSLEKKGTLLQELHHRVKNNLQTILGLIGLQKRSLPAQSPVRDRLERLQNRIYSIGLIHKLLYSQSRVYELDCDEYFQELIGEILRSIKPSSLELKSTVEIDPVTMRVDRLRPLGLILNELVTNAIQHGFQNTGNGKITISLNQRSSDTMTLRVSDNGPGLQQDQSLDELSSIGWKLINNLVDQVDGDLRITEEDGFTVEVTFQPG